MHKFIPYTHIVYGEFLRVHTKNVRSDRKVRTKNVKTQEKVVDKSVTV